MLFDTILRDLNKLASESILRPSIGLESKIETETIADLKTAFLQGTENAKLSLIHCKRVIAYSKAIAARDEHLSFFGGNLFGVDKIRWLPSDRDRWFDEVLEIDEDFLESCIHKVPSVDKNWNVAGDVYNISVVWFIHRCFRDLNPKDKLVHEAMIEALVMLQFKFLSSWFANFFTKPVDTEAATAVYSALSLKFTIKRLGSWGAVLKDRAENIIDKMSIHYKTFDRFDDDKAILYVVTDISTRVRKMIKDQYRVLEQVRSGNLRIETTSSTVTMDGESFSRDKVSSYDTAKNYLLDVSGNESSFIKTELINIVLDLMTTTSKQSLLDILKSIARTPFGKKRDEVESMMIDTLLHAYDYILSNRIAFNDIGLIMVKMKALYMSSKTSDERILSLRSRLEKYAKQHSALRSSSALASVRTALLLYFLLRALSISAYN